MIDKVLHYIEENHMLQAGDTVAAGISGGADSVCLLFILVKLREKIPFRLTAVHVNHRIRVEAAGDAAYVEKLCRDWNCGFYYAEEDVRAYASAHRLSEEEAGRIIRYDAFRRALEDTGAPEGKIAVAHNKNDNAETVLFHLIRGCGLTGLTGIRPVRGRIIRPLLCVSRPEIERFLDENGLSYCIDRTNNDDTYTRNKIRHHILGFAEQEISSRAVSHIYDTSVILAEAEDYIRENTERALGRCARWEGKEVIFQADIFCREHPMIQKQCILYAIERAAGSRKDISAVHVENVRQLFFRKGNGRTDLPYGLTACREYGCVRLFGRDGGKEQAEAREVPVPGEIGWPGGMKLVTSVFPREKSQNIEEKTYTKWFDYDKIIKCLVLRGRQTGDYLQAYADGGRKTLKAYFIEEKIPRAKRDSIPLLADGSHILWIIGGRISEYYKIDEQTKTVLQVQVTGGTIDGGEHQSVVDGGGSRQEDSGNRGADQ